MKTLMFALAVIVGLHALLPPCAEAQTTDTVVAQSVSPDTSRTSDIAPGSYKGYWEYGGSSNYMHYTFTRIGIGDEVVGSCNKMLVDGGGSDYNRDLPLTGKIAGRNGISVQCGRFTFDLTQSDGVISGTGSSPLGPCTISRVVRQR